MPDSWPGLREELRAAATRGTAEGSTAHGTTEHVEPVKARGLTGGPRNGAPAPPRDLMAEANAALRSQVRQARVRRHDAAD